MNDVVALWVEDDTKFQDSLTPLILRHAPNLVLVRAATRNQAKTAFAGGGIDRLIVDLCLGEYGDLGGFEFLEWVRFVPDNTPAIVFSGELTLALSLTVKRLGAVDFVKKGALQCVKPFAQMILDGYVDPLFASPTSPGLARANRRERIADAIETLPGKVAEELHHQERILIVRARDSEPSIAAAAAKLGWPRQTLEYKLKKI